MEVQGSSTVNRWPLAVPNLTSAEWFVLHGIVEELLAADHRPLSNRTHTKTKITSLSTRVLGKVFPATSIRVSRSLLECLWVRGKGLGQSYHTSGTWTHWNGMGQGCRGRFFPRPREELVDFSWDTSGRGVVDLADQANILRSMKLFFHKRFNFVNNFYFGGSHCVYIKLYIVYKFFIILCKNV